LILFRRIISSYL